MSRHRLVEPELAVDPKADAEVIAARLEMDVGGAALQRPLQDLVDGTNDGRATGEVLQSLDRVEVDMLHVDLGRLGLGRGPTLAGDAFEDEIELLEGEHAEPRHGAERQRHRLDRVVRAGVGHREPQHLAIAERQREAFTKELQGQRLVR